MCPCTIHLSLRDEVDVSMTMHLSLRDEVDVSMTMLFYNASISKG